MNFETPAPPRSTRFHCRPGVISCYRKFLFELVIARGATKRGAIHYFAFGLWTRALIINRQLQLAPVVTHTIDNAPASEFIARALVILFRIERPWNYNPCKMTIRRGRYVVSAFRPHRGRCSNRSSSTGSRSSPRRQRAEINTPARARRGSMNESRCGGGGRPRRSAESRNTDNPTAPLIIRR